MWLYGSASGAWGSLLMGISMVLLWGLVICGVVMLIRALGPQDRRGPRSSTPEQLLAERFARGEIDAQEYRLRIDVLRDHRQTLRH